MSTKPWYIHAMAFCLAVVWMGWTFAAIQNGASAATLGSSVIIYVVAVCSMYGTLLDYFRWGDFEVGTVQRSRREPEEEEEPQALDEKYR